MIKELWINLPVKDVGKSKEFFTKIGFTLQPQHANSDEMAGLSVGVKGIIVMLFPEAQISKYAKHEITDTKHSTEVLFSIDAESKEEVDSYVTKVREAGGTIYDEPREEDGWMYGLGFVDLDGHRWNVLYMDISKMKR